MIIKIVEFKNNTLKEGEGEGLLWPLRAVARAGPPGPRLKA